MSDLKRRVVIEVTVEPWMSHPRDWRWTDIMDDVDARFISEGPVPPESKEFRLSPADPDTQTCEIICPHCGAEGSIVEVDEAVRCNQLTVEMHPDGPYVHASLGDGDYHFSGWLCTSCYSDNIDAPEGFEIGDWS